MTARKPTIACWFEFASTYSYLAIHRAGEIAAAHGVAVQWKPFLLGPLFNSVGWNDSPFNLYPAKGSYMWRDMERLCEKHGLPLRRPSRFPRSGLLAARITCGRMDEPWALAFARSVYHANFVEDRDIADRTVVAELLREAGQDAASTLAQADSAASKARLRQQTEEARALGIFGAPTFVAAGELFWGNDRLDDAIQWSLHHAA